MAHEHNAIHRSPLGRALLNALGQDEGELARFGETLTPTIDLWRQPEWAFLRSEILFARRQFVAAAAGLFSSLELVNAATSRTIAVVELIRNGSAGNVDVQLDTGNPIGVLATTRGLSRDSRFPQLGAASQLTLVSGQLAAGANLPQDTVPAAQASDVRYVVAPGGKLFVFATAVNSAISCALIWRERNLFPGELD